MRRAVAAAALLVCAPAAAAAQAHTALSAAVRNATSDLDEFVAILADWLEGRPGDRDALVAFLAMKAVRPHRGLERTLDWVLWFYRTAWPFVLVFLVFKLTTRLDAAAAASADGVDALPPFSVLSPRAAAAANRSRPPSCGGTPRSKPVPASAPVTPRFAKLAGGAGGTPDSGGLARSASAASRYAARLPRDARPADAGAESRRVGGTIRAAYQ